MTPARLAEPGERFVVFGIPDHLQDGIARNGVRGILGQPLDPAMQLHLHAKVKPEYRRVVCPPFHFAIFDECGERCPDTGRRLVIPRGWCWKFDGDPDAEANDRRVVRRGRTREVVES